MERRSPRGCSDTWMSGLQRHPALPVWGRWHSVWMLVRVVLGPTPCGDFQRGGAAGLEGDCYLQHCPNTVHTFLPMWSSCPVLWEQSRKQSLSAGRSSWWASVNTSWSILLPLHTARLLFIRKKISCATKIQVDGEQRVYLIAISPDGPKKGMKPACSLVD